jgi:hypothetical protein
VRCAIQQLLILVAKINGFVKTSSVRVVMFLRSFSFLKQLPAPKPHARKYLQLRIHSVMDWLVDVDLPGSNPCELLGRYQSFGGTYYLHFLPSRWRQYVHTILLPRWPICTSSQHQITWSDLLLRLLFCRLCNIVTYTKPLQISVQSFVALPVDWRSRVI